MPNRIKGPDSQPVGAGGSKTVARARSTSSALSNTAAPSSSGSGDSVTLTAASQQLNALAQTISGLPDVNAQKIEAVQTAISNGQYQVNPEKIADKLLQIEGDLQASGRR